jgi:hypothetical protein
MAYSRTTWENSPSTDTPLSADNLNNIETGILGVESSVSALSGTVGLLAGTAGIAVNITSTQGSVASTQGSVASTQGSVASTQGSVVAINASLGSALGTISNNTAAIGSVSGTVTNIVNQFIGTAIDIAATPGSVYTLGTADSGRLLVCAGTASGTVQIPIFSSQPFNNGQKVDLVQLGTGTVTVVGTAGVTLRSTPSNVLRTQYSVASVIKIGSNEWLLMGDLF